jgi:hypothetical protein
MISFSSCQDWLFYSPLAQQAALLKDDLLDPVDRLLDDPTFGSQSDSEVAIFERTVMAARNTSTER